MSNPYSRIKGRDGRPTASDCGVSMPTAKQYFGILEDTLIGGMVPPFLKRPKRRTIHAPKFYCGIHGPEAQTNGRHHNTAMEYISGKTLGRRVDTVRV